MVRIGSFRERSGCSAGSATVGKVLARTRQGWSGTVSIIDTTDPAERAGPMITMKHLPLRTSGHPRPRLPDRPHRPRRHRSRRALASLRVAIARRQRRQMAARNVAMAERLAATRAR